MPGVRAPSIAPLTASDGTISGMVKLNAKEVVSFHRGGLYVEIDSADAPEGDLWGWVMPPAKLRRNEWA